MKRAAAILIAVLVMAVVNSEILSLLILCGFSIAGIVKLFVMMAEHNI